MPLIWCSISGHGFGHAAQVISVLNALATQASGLRAVLRTTVPSWFFDRLELPWEISPAEQDIGCIQDGPLAIDYPETFARHVQFQSQWDDRVAAEVREMRARRPTLVLSDISWLAIEAGTRLEIPCIALCNLSWDQVLEPVITPGNLEHRALLAQIRAAYGKAELMVRLAPGLPMPAFSKIADVGPVAQSSSTLPIVLHDHLPIPPEDRTVLVGFGGISLNNLPFEHMEQIAGYQFLVSGAVPPGLHRCHAANSLPASFSTLLVSTDLIMTKPGYSTITEAVARNRPVLYVRRYNFADEEPMVQYLHRYGRGVELSAKEFVRGAWKTGLQRLQETPAPPEHPPSPTGAFEAAGILAKYF